ncbi:MAG: MlaD family protein [Nocardioidaceae bacterium]
MIKHAPSVGRIIVMVAFALSCFAILVFLWLSFGGAVPLQPKGYRMHVSFPEATQLAQEADVRIAGVDVGRVSSKRPDASTGLTDVTIELRSDYAPVPRDTRAILRQKTLLGETYVELTPGDRRSGQLADGGRLPQGQVSPTVELDEIFRAFDRPTRAAFSTWLDQQGRAVSGSGEQLNDALGNLEPFAQDTERVLAVLRRQEAATRGLVRDTGAVFEALSERRGQLRGLIANANRVFATTAARDRELAATVFVLPTFLREARATTNRLTRFARRADPLVTQLRPAASELSPTLRDLRAVAPDLRGLLRDLGPLITVSRSGLPALERVLDDARPLLARLDPFLRTVIPITDYLGVYRREIAAFFALDTAATQATEDSPALSRPVHYLRTTNPLNPENLAGYPRRLPTNRSNPYVEPGGSDAIRRQGHLDVLGRYLCPGPGLLPTLDPSIGTELIEQLERFAYNARRQAGAAPPCTPQRPLGRLVPGQAGRLFPQLRDLPAVNP